MPKDVWPLRQLGSAVRQKILIPGVFFLIAAGLAKSFLLLGRKVGVDTESARPVVRKLLLSPLPLVFDQPDYFSSIKVDLVGANGERTSFDSFSLRPYLTGPWRRQVGFRHTLVFGLWWNPEFFSKLMNDYFCERHLIGSRANDGIGRTETVVYTKSYPDKLTGQTKEVTRMVPCN